MRIIFQKGIDGPDMLICHRDDGSTCQEKLSPGSAYHDVAHFVVESSLGLREGIWGKIAEGFSVAEYNLPNETRPFQISAEGYHAEFLATLIQSAVPSGTISAAYLDMLRQACTASGLPFPELPSETVLEELIADAQALTRAWEALAGGGELELEF
ncbi:MAG TPA: hypothetical protein VHS96_01455 [Bacteroidia bacterium]|nr:hypothetical protein [Bacteroidia bacterium]